MWTENADSRVPFHVRLTNAKHSSFKNFWSARQLQITILSDNWDRVLLRRVDIPNCFSTNLETKCYFFFQIIFPFAKLDATAHEQSIISSVTSSILVPRASVSFGCVVGETSTRFYWGRDWTQKSQQRKLMLDSNAHEQKIICRQSFADHVIKSRPMGRKKKYICCILTTTE